MQSTDNEKEKIMNTIATNNQSSQQNQAFNGDTHQTACVRNFYAQPYSLDAGGFYFSDFEEYQQKVEALRDCWGNQVEEFEIQFIDGSSEECSLFQACGVNQANLEAFLEMLDEVADYQQSALYYLCAVQGYSMSDAMGKLDEVTIYAGSLEDASTELFDECYAHQIPENLRVYIDYSAFARDCQYSGDMAEFEFAGETCTCTNANSI